MPSKARLMATYENNDAPTGGRSTEPGERAAESSWQGAPPDISLIEVATVLLRRRHVLMVLPFLVATAVLALAIAKPRTYTTHASFLTQSREQNQVQLRGLAAQFGLEVPGGEVGQGPAFYEDLLETRQIIEPAVLTTYRVPLRESGDTLEGNLVQLLEVEGEDPRLAQAVAIQRLRERVRTGVDQETGVVELSVTTDYATLSKQVADRLIELMVNFNLERRQTQAGAERAFLSEQIGRIERELLEAEEALQTFLRGNRRYQDSPELTFEFDRLQRRVALQQQIYTSLSEALQEARINEVRNTPVITVIDAPDLPARPDRRRLILKAVLGVLAGAMLGLLWAFASAAVSSTRQREPARYAEFERLKRETARELRRITPSWVRRRLGRHPANR